MCSSDLVAVSKALRYLGAKKSLSVTDLSLYSDWDTIPTHLKPFLNLYIAELGYGGDHKKNLNAKRKITRAEAAVITRRLMSWAQGR